jgi:hypothetical protein
MTATTKSAIVSTEPVHMHCIRVCVVNDFFLDKYRSEAEREINDMPLCVSERKRRVDGNEKLICSVMSEEKSDSRKGIV